MIHIFILLLILLVVFHNMLPNEMILISAFNSNNSPLSFNSVRRRVGVSHDISSLHHGNSIARIDTSVQNIRVHPTNLITALGFASSAEFLETRQQQQQQDEQQESSSMELWLDLRGTAISPRVALHHLLTELHSTTNEDDDDNFLASKIQINRVLISNFDKQTYEKQCCLLPDVQMKPLHQMISDGLIIVADHGNSPNISVDHWNLVCVSSTSSEPQQHAGELVIMRDATNLVNPIPVMMCLERGGWAILDSSNIPDEQDRMHAMSSVVNLLSGLSSSFHLSTSDDNKSSSMRPVLVSGGGVAVVCSNNQDIFNFAPLIESLRSQGDSSVSTTDCGILTISSSNKKHQRHDGETKPTIEQATALVLPFDPVLWKTLSLFMQ